MTALFNVGREIIKKTTQRDLISGVHTHTILKTEIIRKT